MLKPKIVNNEVFPNKKILTYSMLTIIFILTSFLSVYYIYSDFSNTSSFLTFKVTSPSIILYLIILLILYYIFDCLRFYYVLKTLKIKVDFLYIFKLNFISGFLSNITPWGTGGGLSQLYYMNKKDISIGDATAIATIKGLLPVIFFFLATPFVLLTDRKLLKIFPSGNSLMSISALILIYIILSYYFYKLVNNTKTLKRVIYRILYFLAICHVISEKTEKNIRKKTFLEIDKFALSIKRFVKGDALYVFLSILYMIIYFFIMFLFPLIIMRGFGYNVSMLQIIPLQIVLNFVTYIAPTPGATGIAEGGFSLLFSDYISSSDLAPITFWWRFFTLYLTMIIGLFLFYFDILKKKVKSH